MAYDEDHTTMHATRRPVVVARERATRRLTIIEFTQWTRFVEAALRGGADAVEASSRADALLELWEARAHDLLMRALLEERADAERRR